MKQQNAKRTARKIPLDGIKKAPAKLAAALRWADVVTDVLKIVRRAAEEIRDLIEREGVQPEDADANPHVA